MRKILRPKPNVETVSHLQEVLGVSETIGYLLAQRGITGFDEARDFFRPNLQKLHNPFLMKDMEKAVGRILEALENKERILVYGDYDVDGTTSVALMTTFLKEYTDQVESYIPDRYREGYGISIAGIDFAVEAQFSLVIALDCGIKAIRQMHYARKKGIDFIICDHHLPGSELPEAYAVLDPKRKDCNYPFKELCGCGVGFKLIQAITRQTGRSFKSLFPYLDLVATAIGADIVPVTGENRILAYHGLHILNTRPRPGFRALMDQLKKKKGFTITDVVFIIAPRINAAGRMKHALYAARLLMTEDIVEARKLANEIETYNAERRTADQTITDEALIQIRENKEQERFTTVVYNEKWHKGVIGIVASRLTETYYRPTLVFTKSGEKLAASARSIKGFNVYNALEACQDFIEQFGGHKYAAGLTLAQNQYEKFKQKFEKVVASTIDRNLLEPSILIDKIIDFREITPKFNRILKQFAPFGPGNYRPVFLTQGVCDRGYAKTVGKEGEHLKCSLYQLGDRFYLEAIGFNLGSEREKLSRGNTVDVVYTVEENVWQNRVRLQLKLKVIS